ncbi:MAG: hypothetical protein CVU34_20160 [Betaproteobacteria bacterium HGW-Betaproteobacteria-7]|jgi:uncharacterized protein (DUF302 family)|nr:MAG: hypothetical protein CVU34_20160 [Betaproteobacteria bacterium HGW-Betaproteobacteria-7]
MIFSVESDKSFYEASVDLGEVLLRLGFVVLQVDDQGESLRNRGLACDEELKVFAVASPRLTEGLLAIEMRLGLALPWRLSVFTEEGVTRLGFLRPSIVLPALSPRAATLPLAEEFEARLRQAVEEAR